MKIFFPDYSQKCPDCQKCFYSATTLLIHFFSHVGEEKSGNGDNGKNSSTSNKKHEEVRKIETSNPINLIKDETFNPWQYCLATFDENVGDSSKSRKNTNLKKKRVQKKQEKDKTFECNLCSKKFGWSTDLKRHILIHTGILCVVNY